MSNKNPKFMTDVELENTISQINILHGKYGVMEYLEQWDMPIEILDRFSLFSKVKLIDRVDWKGKRAEFVKVYMTELRKLYNSDKIDLTLLGMTTALTMFIGYEDNVLRDEEGKPLTQKEIAKRLKISPETIKRYFKILEELDVLLKRKSPNDRRNNEYLLSPEIFYKGVKMNKDKKEYFIKRREKKKENEKLKKENENVPNGTVNE